MMATAAPPSSSQHSIAGGSVRSHNSSVDKMMDVHRKVASSISSRQRRRPPRRSRSGDSLRSGASSVYSNDDYSEYGGTSSSYGGGGSTIGTGVSTDFLNSSNPQKKKKGGSKRRGSYYDPLEDKMKDLTISVPRRSFGDYMTIDQKEFFTECMMDSGDGCRILHFFSNDCPTSVVLDNHMATFAQEVLDCRFLRIDSEDAEFIASKLRIIKFPTILVLRNKVVLGMFSPDDEEAASKEAVHLWLKQIVPEMRNDDFDDSLRDNSKLPYAGHLDDLDDEDASQEPPFFGDYATLDQNEFFMECLVNGHGTQIIHVIDKETGLSVVQDRYMKKLAQDFTPCKFRKIEGEWIRFVAARLQLDSFPAVVVFKSRQVLGQYVPEGGAGNVSQDPLKEWLMQVLLKAEMDQM